MNRSVTVNISNRTIVRVIFIIIVALLLFNFFSSIIRPLTLIFMSFFFALALNPAVSWITRHLKIDSRARATAVAYISILVVIIAFFSLTGPPIFQQAREFVQSVPETVQNFKTSDNSVARLADRLKIDEQLQSSANDFSEKFKDIRGPVLSTGKRIGETIVSIIAVVVMTFMMLVEGPVLIDHFWAVMPAKRREHDKQLARKMYKMVTGFVNGQLLLAICAGTFALVALLISSTLLGVSINAVALASIVAVFGIIPMIGNPLAASVVILMCLFASPTLALIMLAYFIIYFQIENATLQPYIQSRQNELSPLLVFIAAILGIGFAGFIGALIAIPVAGCIKILLADYLDQRRPKTAAETA